MSQFYYSTTYKDRHGKDFITCNNLVEADNIESAAEIAEIECASVNSTLLEVRSFKSLFEKINK